MSKLFVYFFSMEGGELFQRIQDKQAFNERGNFAIFEFSSALQSDKNSN